MESSRSFLTPVLLCALLAGCGDGAGSAPPAMANPATEVALTTITEADLMRHVGVLASDEFLGRSPGSAGEDLTVAYLTEQFRSMGLQPGNPDGTYVQEVPLVGIRSQAQATFRIGDRTFNLSFPDDWVGVSRRLTRTVSVANSDVVFVGYGVRAPEYDWDDYGDMDMTGKTLIMLVNDPPVPHANEAYRLDPDVFGGEAMTYYGRWTYKYEIATELGADAAIIVHETEPAGYPWEVVVGSWGQENFDIRPEDRNMGRVPVEAWIGMETARELFAAAGLDFDELKARARRRDFEPVPLDGRAYFTIRQTLRNVDSKNVIAKLQGSVPERADEYVVYTAHWDHFGVDPSLEDDSIYNGAFDNATGTAGLLELAEAFATLEPPPDRTMLFLAVTAEERGLLGAKYYATEPLYPLERTLANINLDGLNQWGRTRDMVVIGYGNSSLDDVLEREAAAADRVLVPDPEPEKGYYYRSDHFEFAKQGVPALFVDGGLEFIGKPEGYGEQKREEYIANDYHKPSDEIKEDWDLAGAVADLRLIFAVGYDVAQADVWPTWAPGTEFKALREQRLREATGQ